MKPVKVTGRTAAVTSQRCPQCNEPLHASAIVAAFNEPANWTAFWGEQGKRARKCTGQRDGHSFTHFVVVVNGKRTHRLAWVKACA
jgi:hypothetical protein